MNVLVSVGSAPTRRVRSKNQQWTRMFALDDWSARGGKCAYCHAPVARCDVTGDHVQPITGGGNTARENIKAACRPCNLSKGRLTEGAFLKAIKSPKPGDSIHVWLAWSRRRIWLRTERACKRIAEAAR